MMYDESIPHQEILTIPGDSLGNLANPLFEMCGARTATLLDLDNNIVPAYAIVMVSGDPEQFWQADLTVFATNDALDIGEHNLRLTYALQAYPSIE